MNTSRKGWRKELECRKLLQAEGWNIIFKSIRTRWFTVDFAHLFDTVAVHLNIDGKPEWAFISNKHFQGFYPQHQQQIKDFKNLYGFENAMFQLWLWHIPKWVGRSTNKRWQEAKWEIISI